MADQVNNLLANQFGPLTPEQEAALKRQAIQEAQFSPLDFLLPSGLGAVAGGAAALPFAALPAAINGAQASARGPLATLGIGSALGAFLGAAGVKNSREEMIRRKLQNQDFEGQPGGFYGGAQSTDAEGQPGGFYGAPVNNLLRGR